MKHLFSFIVIAFLSANSLFSQDLILGLKYNYGGTKYDIETEPTEQFNGSYNVFSAQVAFSPFLSRFSVVSGLDVEFRDVANYFTIPLGLRVTVGQDYRIFAEGSMYYSFLFKEGETEYHPKNDLGTKVGCGLVIPLDKRVRLEFSYYYLIGISKSLEKIEEHAFNQLIYYGGQTRAWNLGAGIKYRF